MLGTVIGSGHKLTTIRKTGISAFMELAFYSNTLALLTATSTSKGDCTLDGMENQGESAGKL